MRGNLPEQHHPESDKTKEGTKTTPPGESQAVKEAHSGKETSHAVKTDFQKELPQAGKHLPDTKLHEAVAPSHEHGTKFTDYNFKKDFHWTKTDDKWSSDKAHNAEKIDYPPAKDGSPRWKIFEQGKDGELNRVISSDGSVWTKNPKHPEYWTIDVAAKDGPPARKAAHYSQKMDVEIDKTTQALKWKVYENKSGQLIEEEKC